MFLKQGHKKDIKASSGQESRSTILKEMKRKPHVKYIVNIFRIAQVSFFVAEHTERIHSSGYFGALSFLVMNMGKKK